MQEAKIEFRGRSEFRYQPKRVCIPVGMACNVKCTYCMRDAGRIREPREVSPDMRRFLSQLDPATTEAVIANGGEPLLYLERIKEIFSLVPPEIHRAVMTNGTLMTDGIADWLNGIDGELHFSHEGTASKALKGVDVLEDEKILRSLNRVKTMRVYTIVTAKNPDVLKSYEYIAEKLHGVKNLWFTPFPMFAFGGQDPSLTEGFDYDTFARSTVELWQKHPEAVGRNAHHRHYVRNTGHVILPDASVASLVTLRRYGTVFESKEAITARAKAMGEYDYCLSQDCPAREHCSMAMQIANPFTCKALRTYLAALDYMRTFNVL